MKILEFGEAYLHSHNASDLSVVNSARVSFGKRVSHMSEADEKLIDFLIRNRHSSPLEHSNFTFFVKCPIFVAREWFRHRIGCLTGDTEIVCYMPSGTAYKKTMKDIYELRHGKDLPERWVKNGYQARDGVTPARAKKGRGRGKPLPFARERTLRVLNEETGFFEKAPMVEIWKTGLKEVFSVETDNGCTLKASADHQFLTKSGWRKTSELVKGDILYTSGMVATKTERNIPKRLREGIGHWTQSLREEIIGEGAACYICGDIFSASDLDLDHIVSVRDDLSKALDKSNLAPACKNCHRGKTNGEQGGRKGQTALGKKETTLLRTPYSVGEEETYDMEVQAPHHNYVANGIVVHNSFNEISMRYTESELEFWWPKELRTQVGKPGSYTFEPVSNPYFEDKIYGLASSQIEEASNLYSYMIESGVAKEIARAILPASMYTQFWWTVNARSLMNFLSLRNHPDAQKEIRDYAIVIESEFAKIMPITYASWLENGRGSP